MLHICKIKYGICSYEECSIGENLQTVKVQPKCLFFRSALTLLAYHTALIFWNSWFYYYRVSENMILASFYSCSANQSLKR